MTSRPTYDDASVILRFYERRRDDRMSDARQATTAHAALRARHRDRNAAFARPVSG